MGSLKDFVKRIKIMKRTENELAKFETRLDEIAQMDVDESKKQGKILEILKEAERKRRYQVIELDVKPSEYQDDYSFFEQYWKDREDVQKAIKKQRGFEVAEILEGILVNKDMDFAKVQEIYEQYNMYYSQNKRNKINVLPENDYEKYQQIKEFMEKHIESFSILNKESMEKKLKEKLQMAVVKRIEEAGDMKEQNRVFEEYVQFSNTNIHQQQGKLDYVFKVVGNSEFMKQRTKMKNFKEYGLDLKFEDKIPVLYEATEENEKEVERKNEYLASERMEDSITEEDLILVRSTDVFPKHRLIETIDKHTMPEPMPSYFAKELKERIDSKELSQYDVLDFINRRTIHWTLNGLVGDHQYGKFSNRKYIIVEPLEEQIQNEGLLSLNEADTYFEQDMKLSPRATILMPIEQYGEVLKDPTSKKQLEGFDIAVYTGEDYIATKMLLNDKEYIFGDIGTWGYITNRNTDAGIYADKLEEGIENISERLREEGRPIEDTKIHRNSKSYAKDNERRYTLYMEGIERFVDFLADKSDEELPVESIKRELLRREGLDYKQYASAPEVSLEEVVDSIGVEELKEITKEYNEYMLVLYREERRKKDKENVEKGLITEDELEEDYIEK